MPVRPRFEEGRKAWDGETAQILSRVAFRSVETDTQPGHCRKPELPSLGSVQADFPHANSQQRRSGGRGSEIAPVYRLRSQNFT